MLENYNKKNTPFKVPDNYFEDMNKELMARIDSLPKKEVSTKVVPLWRKIMPLVSIAAAIIAVVMVVNIDFVKDSADTSVEGKYYTEQTSKTMEDEYYSFVEEELSASAYDEFMLDELQNDY